jgi:CHAD domain-containing protein
MPGYQRTFFLKPVEAAAAPQMTEALLQEGYRLRQSISQHETRSYYDTFEWQAFDKGFSVASTGRILSLYDLDSGCTLEQERFISPPSFFAADLPLGPLRDRLFAVSPIRAFMRLIQIDVAVQSWKLLDREEKTLGTVRVESWSSDAPEQRPPFASFMSLNPLRGYQEEMLEAAALLAPGAAFGDEGSLRRLFIDAMAASGLQVGGYSSKIELILDPEAPVHESALSLLRFTTSIMRLNEDGIRKSIDTEFLHDYRVAIRRARSILAQLKGVFPPEAAGPASQAVKAVAAKTGPLRDLDVYLLEQDRFRSWLPPALHPGLDTFFTALGRRRKTLQRSFSTYLDSPAYEAFLNEWNAFIDDSLMPDAQLAPNASLPTITVAGRTIRKSWKKLIRHGRMVSSETTDDELHAMRIDCKKLRYLLEFFMSLFPAKTVMPAIGHLKGLQDNLGSFVDCSVQLRFLRDQLETAGTRRNDMQLAASLGGLMAVLHERQEKARRDFHKAFSRFDDDRTAELFEQLTTG